MKMNDAFPSKYISKEDLDQKTDTIVTIKGDTMEPVGPKREICLVIFMDEFEKGWVCNKTNLRCMFVAHECTDTKQLVGKRVSLYVDHEVTYGGEVVGGIRVRATEPDAEEPAF